MALPQLTNAVTFDFTALPRRVVTSLYVHIPFCFHKCHYCDFYSITRQGPDRMARFVDRILTEAEQWNASPLTVRPDTIFFGGGTPSLLPLDEMDRLLRGLKRIFQFESPSEWTVEVNPATARLEYCQMLRRAGVNRLSFGAQSFDPADLKVLERHHDPADVGTSLKLARAAGFDRLNLDLIYAVPGQSLETWHRNLDLALEFGTEHLSCYALTYEPNTPMAVRRRLGHFLAAEETLEIAMLRATRDRLSAAGLPAYEISNHARPGAECRHNLVYWQGGDYIGLGPSAASHVQGWRWKNRGHLGEWESAIDAQRLPAADVEQLNPIQRQAELAMLLLRLRTGIIFEDFRNLTGGDARTVLAGEIERYTQAGLLEADASGIRLTDRGVEVADGLATELMLAFKG